MRPMDMRRYAAALLLIATLLCTACTADGAVMPAAKPAASAGPSGTMTPLSKLYLAVLDELMETDSALNADIEIVALDLSEAKNLTDAEREAIRCAVEEKYGMETVANTFDGLCDAGSIDRETLFFENGVLLSIETEADAGSGRFTFRAEKWRSGLGAILFTDCTATYKGGAWSYEIGGFAIS